MASYAFYMQNYYFEAISNLCNFENSKSFEECEFKDHIELVKGNIKQSRGNME
mgnify:CR=1 FL=1